MERWEVAPEVDRLGVQPVEATRTTSTSMIGRAARLIDSSPMQTRRIGGLSERLGLFSDRLFVDVFGMVFGWGTSLRFSGWSPVPEIFDDKIATVIVCDQLLRVAIEYVYTRHRVPREAGSTTVEASPGS